jgi:hypothetical protein
MRRRFLHNRAAVQQCLGLGLLVGAFTLLPGVSLFTTTAHAQAYNGAIVGTVTDSSGASIPNVKITAVNTGNNNKYTATSSGSGSYTIAQLPIGVYVVHAEAANFKEAVVNNVEVHVSTNAEVNPVLQVGTVSEKVTVQADSVQVQTTSATVGEVISGTQVRELPLNGENFVGLTQLSPGVSAAQGANFVGKGLDGGVNFSVNGNPYNYNLFLVDGVNNNDVGSGRTILVYPAVDTIAEFKMIRNSYGPEYGQASGAIISINTKSGTNQFHGGAFYAGRNEALNANNWFANHNNLGKAKERRNDYGYNLSGPVVKDKLFLWWNQEWNKETQGVPLAACVPTTAESQGDFTGYAPGATTDQCGATLPTLPGSTTPGGKIANPDPAGLLLAQFYPAPNLSALNNGNNYSQLINNQLNWSEWNVRGDYDVTKSNRVTVRWTQDSWDNPAQNDGSAFWGESNFPTVDSSWSQPSKSVMAKLSSTISNSMVNDVEFGYGHNAIITTLGGTHADIVPKLQAAYPTTFPGSIKQKDEFFGGWGGLNPYGYVGGNSGGGAGQTSMWNIAPYGNHEDLYTLQDNLSKVQGNHLLKTGIFLGWNEKVENVGAGGDRPGLPGGIYTGPGSLGSVTANAQTNNNLANVLLPGTGPTPQMFSSVAENSIDGIADVHWRDIEPYVGDTWKIRRNVTLDYGFRWSFYREPYGGTTGGNTNPASNGGGNFPDQWANFSMASWSAAEAKANPSDACNGTLIVPGTTPCANQRKFLSSIGVNLPLSNGTPGPNAALVQQNNHSIAPRFGVAWDVFGNGKTAVRVGAGQFFQREPVGLAEGLARTAPFVIGVSTNRSLDAPTPLTSASVSPNASKSTGGFLPNSWQWNVSLEQEVARNSTLQIGYVGNVGEHLTSMYDANFIQPGNWLNSAFANGSSAVNAFRPAFNFGQIGGYARGGHASYNSLQVLFRAQQGTYSTFQAAYTWSHSLGNVELDNSSNSINQQAITDQTHPGLDKGNTNINRPNIFTANEVLFLPKFEGQNKLVQNSAGGWEFNSIFTMAQGSSFSVFSNGASGAPVNGVSSTLNSLAGTGFGNNQRPLVTNVGCNVGRKGPAIENYEHFTLIGYTIGTFPSNLASRGSCFGAPNTNVDAQLAKNWSIKEKYQIKFSMDFFDLFNHPNFNSANLEGSGFTSSSPVYCGGATATSGQPCSPTNNVITSASTPTGFNSAATENLNQGRNLQYTLRFRF